jgi:hypothetical protein
MSRALVLLLLLGFFLPACADYDSGADGSISDGQADGSNGDADGLVLDCTQGVSACPNGLDCLCCGSIGPAPICLCTQTCKANSSCDVVGLSRCNTPGTDSDGICTPPDFNCCWYCE